MVQPETRIVRKIKEYLTEEGIFHFKVWGNEHMMAGLPDLICCVNGLFVGMEVKTEEGDTTARQVYVHQRIRQSLGIVGVVRSVSDAENLVRFARAITPGNGRTV